MPLRSSSPLARSTSAFPHTSTRLFSHDHRVMTAARYSDIDTASSSFRPYSNGRQRCLRRRVAHVCPDAGWIYASQWWSSRSARHARQWSKEHCLAASPMLCHVRRIRQSSLCISTNHKHLSLHKMTSRSERHVNLQTTLDAWQPQGAATGVLCGWRGSPFCRTTQQRLPSMAVYMALCL